jgi:hypothetical protein
MRSTTTFALILVLVFAAAAAAQSVDPLSLPEGLAGGTPIQPAADLAVPDSWGTDDFTVVDYGWVNMSPVTPGMNWSYLGSGYFYHDGGSDSLMCGSLDAIPSGARLQLVGAYHYDDNVSENLTFALMRYYGASSYDEVFAATPDHAQGYALSWWDLGLGYTVDHYSNTYMLCLWLPSTPNGSIAFRSFKLLYRLQVSPAPASATFNDVPTSHPFFRYVEALADSGITAGCGNNNYCPDTPVSRGQMAVFLAKALGLHYPAF